MRSSKSAINQFGEKKNKETKQTTIGHLVTFKDLSDEKNKGRTYCTKVKCENAGIALLDLLRNKIASAGKTINLPQLQYCKIRLSIELLEIHLNSTTCLVLSFDIKISRYFYNQCLPH